MAELAACSSAVMRIALAETTLGGLGLGETVRLHGLALALKHQHLFTMSSSQIGSLLVVERVLPPPSALTTSFRLGVQLTLPKRHFLPVIPITLTPDAISARMMLA